MIMQDKSTSYKYKKICSLSSIEYNGVNAAFYFKTLTPSIFDKTFMNDAFNHLLQKSDYIVLKRISL